MSRGTTPSHVTVNRVLTYFVQNPRACSDVEGLARWQLIEADVRDRLAETQRSLDVLVRRGLLDRLTPEGTAPLYRLNVERQREAQRLLDEGTRRRTPRTGRRARRRER